LIFVISFLRGLLVFCERLRAPGKYEKIGAPQISGTRNRREKRVQGAELSLGLFSELRVACSSVGSAGTQRPVYPQKGENCGKYIRGLYLP